MNDFTEISKSLAPFIPLVKPIFNTFLKPKYKKITSWLKEKSLDAEVLDYKLFETRFQDYLCRTLEKCSIINTLIFPNQQINIESIYQPLTLIDNASHQSEKIKVDKYPDELFNKYQRVLICDSAGMGKSTLSRFICVNAIKENKGIPVFIELRRINSKNTIIQEFLKQLNTIEHTFSIEFIYRLLSLGEFIIIMDGFDEITNEEQESVTQDIRDFVFSCSNNTFLLTSRPEWAITTFGDFKNTYIKGLKNTEAFQLLERYDSITNTSLSKGLIKEISSINIQVNEFLTNPFLVSLLYKTYSFKRDIPSRKSTFYNEVYTALYQDHDLSKDSYKRQKNSNLDIQDFRLVLRELAIMTAKKGEVEYDKTQAIQYISDCKSKLSFLNFKEVSFIEDLLTTVPIFTTEGNKIKWAHKSLQDYFAAEFITYHPKKDLIINHLINKDVRKYQNIIDLVIELDPNLVRHYVLPNILIDIIEHYNKTYQFTNIPKEELSIRRMVTFDNTFWINRVEILDIPQVKEKIDEFERVQNFIKDKFHKKFNSATIYAEEIIVSYTTTNRAYFIQLIGLKGLLGKSSLGIRRRKLPPKELLSNNPIEVNDNDINSIFNNSKYFTAFNNLLTETFCLRYSRARYSFIPQISYCKELLETIKNEIEHNKNETLLDDF